MLAAALALEVDGVRLEVDPRMGGRVTSLRRGDFEVLSGPDVHADNYGSTFWTSPQSDWGWPPPAEIDRRPYSIEATADTLRLTSAPADALGVRVTKRISKDVARRAFVIEYGMYNVSGAPKTYAPWEVTRVHSGGLTFLVASGRSFGPLPLDEVAGVTWFAHDPAALPPAGKKAFVTKAQGWIAHATGTLVYIKSFEEVPAAMQAPGEAEIEIYANTQYVELEVQGPYETIAPGSSVSWAVRWYVRDLPEGVVAAAGSADLVAFVERVLGRPIARGM